MGQAEPKHIKDYLKQITKKIARPNGVLKAVNGSWKDIMSNYSQFSQPISYKENTLYIKVNSAAIYHELSSFGIDEIEDKIFKTLNKKISVKIVI